MKQVIKFIAILSVFLSVNTAADDATLLQKLLQPLDNLQGKFSQQQFDTDGELLQQSEGDFALQRPGKFSWHTALPFEQQLISNGQRLWLYDPDLEQVSIQTVDANLQQTPALILSGNAQQLSENFQIVETSAKSKAGIDTKHSAQSREFLLLPRQADPVFERLILVFKDGVLSDLNVHDSLGQLTQFKLLNVIANAKMAAAQFEFEIPAGTEVISNE